MARFYGEMRGHRGCATRVGHREFRAHIRGWNVGVEVSCRIVDGRDVIEVRETGGSHSPSSKRLLAKIEEQRKEDAT
jgi:hypothetical protein